MPKYIHSNCIGTFVFDNTCIIEEKLNSREEILQNYELLEEGKELPAEKKFSEKYKNAKNSRELAANQKPALQNILDAFNTPEYLSKIREANLLITKKKVADSLRPGHLIIQAVNSAEETDKVGSALARRLREWYELYNPEFSRSIESHEKFAQLIVKKTREELLKEIQVPVEESMGADIEQKDLEAIRELAKALIELYKMRAKQSAYIERSMSEHLPNINAIAGHMIGAKLLALAGSLEKMALFPASTIQLLGAERALFRHIKTGAKSPKYGVIVNHPLIANMKPGERGRAARVLADKLSIAAKIDFFRGDFRGDKLLQEVKEKLKEQQNKQVARAKT